jgi:predicted molibdopterin-dependent oxidoreductase YjgC
MNDLRIPWIPRGRRIKVFVNGQEVVAYQGETVLAALIAVGRRTLRKSLHHSEGRGAFCGMGVCYECLVSINGRSNQRACMTEVENLMEIIIHDPEKM